MKWRLLLLVRRAWQCLFKLWTTQQSWSLGAEGSSWSWWWGWLHQITPELISVAAASCFCFVSWLKSWCCVSAHKLSWELSILSAVWGVLWSFSHLKTLVAIHPFVLNDTTSISFKYLVLILQGRIMCSKAFTCPRYLALFFSVHTVIFFCYSWQGWRSACWPGHILAENKREAFFWGNNYTRKGQWLFWPVLVGHFIHIDNGKKAMQYLSVGRIWVIGEDVVWCNKRLDEIDSKEKSSKHTFNTELLIVLLLYSLL